MMSQILGLDKDIYVLEFLKSLMFIISMSQSEPEYLPPPFLKFDEFIAESIHSQLVNFHSTRHFRFQSYLIRMFLFFNYGRGIQLP